MYEFQPSGVGPMDPEARRYVLPMAMDGPFDDQPPAGDVTRSPIGSLGLAAEDTFGYWFDFGDDWWHQVIVVKIHDNTPPGQYLKVIEKVGDSPPQHIQ